MYNTLRGFIRYFIVYLIITIISLYAFFTKIFTDDDLIVHIANERGIYKQDINVNNFQDLFRIRLYMSLVKYFDFFPSNDFINEAIKSEGTEFFNEENKIDISLFNKNVKSQTKYFENKKYQYAFRFFEEMFKEDLLYTENSYINKIIYQYFYEIRKYKYIEIDYMKNIKYTEEEIAHIYHNNKDTFLANAHYKIKYLLLDEKLYPLIQEDIALGLNISKIAEKYNARLEEDILNAENNLLLSQMDLQASSDNKIKLILYTDFVAERYQTLDEAKNSIIQNYIAPKALERVRQDLKIFTNQTASNFLENGIKYKYDIKELTYKNYDSVDQDSIFFDNNYYLISLMLNKSSDIILFNNKLYVFLLESISDNDEIIQNNNLSYTPKMTDALLNFIIKEKNVVIKDKNLILKK